MRCLLRVLSAMACVIAVAFSSTVLSAQDGASLNYSEEDCYVTGISQKVRCYSLERPIADGSDTITLGGVIIPSVAVVPEPDPFVVLTGGPGGAATDLAGSVRETFWGIRNTRDIIFFDIRGAGMSHAVSCIDDSEQGEPEPEALPLSKAGMEDVVAIIERCYAREGDMLKQATTRTAVTDLDALRLALGVDRINLWGLSYGTRFAQYYMHEHGEHVRSAVLDGLVPFAPSYLPLAASNSAEVLEKVKRDCAADSRCAQAFPGFDPIALLDRIADEQQIQYLHPVTGQLVETTTSRATVAQALFKSLYAAESRVFIPYALTQAIEHNNWGPLAVMSVDMAHYMGIQLINMGPHLSISCAEEKTNLGPRDVSSKEYFMGDSLSVLTGHMCDVWQTEQEPLPQPEPKSISVPTLMLSGGYDPITPPSFADHAGEAFQNVQNFTLENAGHGVSLVPCVADYIARFVQSPVDSENLPECETDGYVPAFILGLAGPVAVGDYQ